MDQRHHRPAGRGVSLGLRVIVTARATGSAHAVMTAPLLRRLNDLQATTLMLSGNPTDSGQRSANKFVRFPHKDADAVCWLTATRFKVNWSTRSPARRRCPRRTAEGILMTLRVVPEGLTAASSAVEALTARLAAAHAAAAPVVSAVVPPAAGTPVRCRRRPASALTARSTMWLRPKASKELGRSGVGVGESGARATSPATPWRLRRT